MSYISLEDFNDNFMIYIRALEEEHQDETGSYDYGVAFNVVCNNNNRVMYFEAHVTSNMLPPSYTNSNIIDVGWSNVLPDVKTWASDVIYSSNILGQTYIPSIATNSNLDFSTTSNYNFGTFNSNYTIKVSRMEPYPSNQPSCWSVAFIATQSNNPNVYMSKDTQVKITTFAIYQAEQEILNNAWSNVKESFGQWAENIYHQSLFINSIYTSSNW